MYLKHGKSRTPEYKCWQQLKARCLDPKHSAYANYGGRGITVHPEWVHNFESFLDHVGLRPDVNHSLDRLDNERGYEPGNVAWVTQSKQLQNRRAFGEGVKVQAKLPGQRTNFKHGLIRTPEYKIWSSMKDRCLNPKSSNYPRWGGRGITIYESWVNNFPAFYLYLQGIIGLRPSPLHTLDRIDNDRGYEPGNLRWATRAEQNTNRGKHRTGANHGNYKHGGVGTPEHKTWLSIKTRCFNANNDRYKDYGSRGITMCRRWRDSFEAFFEDMGPKPHPDHHVLRTDSDKHYSCGKCSECISNGWTSNCKWASRVEINQSRKPSSRSGKLTMEKAREIRVLYADGVPNSSLAKEFGVGRSLIVKVVRNEVWRE